MRGIQTTIILVLNLLPSYLLRMDQVAIMYLLPQTSLEVGELIVVPNIDKMNWLMDNKKFERINSKLSFAVVGLTTSAYETINQISTETTYKWLQPSRKWYSQRLTVSRPQLKDASRLRLPTAVWNKVNDNNQIKLDREVMANVLSSYDDSDDLLKCMKHPLPSHRVSKFASPRYLPNGHAYYHTGVDLRAYSPTPLGAMADGKVVFADHMVTPGNLIVLSHGKGLFSRYMHLSTINVSVGDKVKAGQIVGLTGQTGRVEAPHLHWEIIWKGNHADPENFLLQWERTCDRS